MFANLVAVTAMGFGGYFYLLTKRENKLNIIFDLDGVLVDKLRHVYTHDDYSISSKFRDPDYAYFDTQDRINGNFDVMINRVYKRPGLDYALRFLSMFNNLHVFSHVDDGNKILSGCSINKYFQHIVNCNSDEEEFKKEIYLKSQSKKIFVGCIYHEDPHYHIRSYFEPHKGKYMKDSKLFKLCFDMITENIKQDIGMLKSFFIKS